MTSERTSPQSPGDDQGQTNSSSSTTNSTGKQQSRLVSAVRYARMGWSVIPLHDVDGGQCTCGRGDCGSPGKHPRTKNGVKDATTDLQTIFEWWRKWPPANIGLATGRISGLVVVDIDPRNGGDDSFDALIDEHGPFPDTVESITGGGGRHIFFAYPENGIKLPAKLADGIDVKSDGGYVVGPGSNHASGGWYEWEHSSDPGQVDVAPLPSWIYKTTAGSATTPTEGAIIPSRVLDGVPEGSRDTELFNYARYLRDRGNERVEAEILVSHAAANCFPPFPRSEALKKVESAYSRSPAGGEKRVSAEVDEAWSALATALPHIQNDLLVAYSDEVFANLVTIGQADPTDIWYVLHRLRKYHTYHELTILHKAVSDAALTGELEIRHIEDWARDVDAAPDPGWAAKPVWPGDAYGVLAAESKAGKTWAALDFGVAKASGTKWMGVYPCGPAAPVLIFLGEGGERNTVRRLRAICCTKGLKLEDLPIRVSFRVPHLGSQHHLKLMRDEVEEHPPGLIIIDPLYLAASGASGSSLYDIAEYLQAAQHVAQKAGAALVIVHHYNQTGSGGGARRMSGAGPEEWGRVLAAADLVDKKPKVGDDGSTTVTLKWTFTGGEIGHHQLTVRRTVRAENPDDLTSPMHYDIVEVADSSESDPLDQVPASAQEAYGVLARQSPGTLLTTAQVRQSITDERHDRGSNPMPPRTVQAALKTLEGAGLADHDVGKGGVYLWKVVHEPTEEAANPRHH